MGVCKHWRASISGSPHLWAEICIDAAAERARALAHASARPPAAAAVGMRWPKVAAWLAAHAPHAQRLRLELAPEAGEGDCGDPAAAIAALAGSLRGLTITGAIPFQPSVLAGLGRCTALTALRLAETPSGFWSAGEVAAVAGLPHLTHVSVSACNVFLHNAGPLRERQPPLRQLDVAMPDPVRTDARLKQSCQHTAFAAAALLGQHGQGLQQAAQVAFEEHGAAATRQMADDLLMLGVLNMLSAMASMLYSIVDSRLAAASLASHIQAAAAAGGLGGALQPQQQHPGGGGGGGCAAAVAAASGAAGAIAEAAHGASPCQPAMAVLMGHKGNLSAAWSAAGATRDARDALVVVTDHLTLVYSSAAYTSPAAHAGHTSGAGAATAVAQGDIVLRMLDSRVDVRSAQMALLQPFGFGLM
jgi:hypothetical protein